MPDPVKAAPRRRDWEGEPHVLAVHEVEPPDDPFGYGDLEYELEHPADCGHEDTGGTRYCDVDEIISHEGLPTTLAYSRTPVTEPGTYTIRAWGCTYHDADGTEYDSGVQVTGRIPGTATGQEEAPDA